MAKNTNRNAKPSTDKKGYTADADDEAKGKPQRRQRRGQNSGSGRERGNDTLDRFVAQTYTTGNSLLFPMDSYAMTANGSKISSPGQNNFIKEWGRLYQTDDASDIKINVRWMGVGGNTVERIRSAMVFGVIPYFGDIHTSVDGVFNSPIAMAAANLKQFVDTSFGTRTDYAPQDMITYLMGAAAIFPLAAEIKRDLQLCYTYVEKQFPQFFPQGMFTALHISDDNGDIANGAGALYTAKHLREFVDRLNQILLQFNRLPMPPEIRAFGYNDDIFSRFYTDSPDLTTAQIYAFKNNVAWQYVEELVANEGAALIPVRVRRENADVFSVAEKLELLAGLVNSISVLRTDSGAMLQNLFNAYGSRDTVQIDLMDFTSMTPVEFLYDPAMLTSIENMKLCPSNKVQFTPILASAQANAVIGHIFVKPTDDAVAEMVPNLPLQFHKDAATIGPEDIGPAMRFHPCFLTQKPIQWYDTEGQLHEESRLTADGFTGFAFVNTYNIVGINNNGTITTTTSDGFNIWDATDDVEGANNLVDYGFYDFSTVPIHFHATVVHPTEDESMVTIYGYAARRDVEVTYRQGDVELFWTYLTQTVWAANVNRNVTGTRK